MLTIGKLAKRTGLSASAIRYYERQGILMPSRLLNGYRVYGEGAVKALHFLRQAQALGIKLKEIKQLLELTRNDQRPCKAVREVANQHLIEVDAKIRQLRSLRSELRTLLSRRVVARSDEICPLMSSTASKRTS